MFYYRGTRLMAARSGPWKAHFQTQSGYGTEAATAHDPPLLYDLEHDPSEKFDVAQDHPDVIAAIRKLVEEHKGQVVPVESQLDRK
jgi:arylsulfatase A-like enzyme